MIKRIAIIVFFAVLGGSYIYNVIATNSACIPIRGVFVRWGDYQRRENIKAALKNIHTYAPEDYERICTRVSFIRLASFKNQLVSTVPPHTQGTYSSDVARPLEKGIMTINRDIAGALTNKLEQTLVHEACHAFLMQTSGDSSEPPCYSRGQEYLLKKPKEPRQQKSLAQKSADLIQETGEKFHVYCSSRERSVFSAKGECVFINYTMENKNMCATVFLKRGNSNAVEREVCGEVDAVGYRSLLFELRYPQNIQERSMYQFGFLSRDGGQAEKGI